MSQSPGWKVITRPRRRARRVLLATATVALSALAGCSPLPGASLDPVYFKLGSQGTQAASQTAPPVPSGSPRLEARTTGAGMWIGRYQDSRGSGDITVSLVRGESTVSGTWQLRTGGGGPLTGVPEAGGRRLQLRMENTARECPGLFEGWMEIGETALVGTYHGKDCEGPVSDGRLELHPK
jgi:hypothetical protein